MYFVIGKLSDNTFRVLNVQTMQIFDIDEERFLSNITQKSQIGNFYISQHGHIHGVYGSLPKIEKGKSVILYRIDNNNYMCSTILGKVRKLPYIYICENAKEFSNVSRYFSKEEGFLYSTSGFPFPIINMRIAEGQAEYIRLPAKRNTNLSMKIMNSNSNMSISPEGYDQSTIPVLSEAERKQAEQELKRKREQKVQSFTLHY